MSVGDFAFNRQLKARMSRAIIAKEGLTLVKSLYETGEVYLVTNQEGELQVFKAGFSGDGRDLRHILPEARALELLAGNKTLQTPKLYSLNEHQLGPYRALVIVKEYVPGKTLDLDSKPVPLAKFTTLEEAIEEAHNCGVANLDIGACNILRRPDGELQLFEYSGVRFQQPQPGLGPNARLWTGRTEFARYVHKDGVDFERTKAQLVEEGKLH